MNIHFSESVGKNCYNLWQSYGAICVHCGCCSDDEIKRTEARIKLHEELLEHDKNFDNWFDDLRELQEENIRKNIEWGERKIKEYKQKLAKLKGEKC